jgi:hypothetical protein
MKKTLQITAFSLLLTTQLSAFTLINSDWAYLGGEPVTVDYTLNANCADAVNELTETQAASGTWDAVDNSCFVFNYNGTNTDTALDDLSVDPIDGNDIFFAGSDPTALAVTQTWTYTSTSNTAEWNMQVYDNWLWDDSGSPGNNEFDLRSVILHELGHGLGLGHSANAAAVMDPTIADGTLERILHQDDIDGLNFIYSCDVAEDCETIAYHSSQGGAGWYAGFPMLATASGDFTKVGYYIDPPANGTVEGMRMQFYNVEAAVPHLGTFRVWCYSDTSGSPESILAGPLDFDASTFTASYGTWDEMDLTPLGFSFTSGTPYHVVWEFLPAAPGTDELSVLGTNGTNVGNQMYNDTQTAWGWWFTDSGDLLEEVDVCYTEVPPGNIVLDRNFVDMGRIEDGLDLETTFYAINDGGMDATVNSVSVSNSATFAASVVPATLAAGDSALVTVTYNSGGTTTFRDTTTVYVDWGVVLDTVEFFGIAGSSACEELVNDWDGEPNELDWYETNYGPTTQTWGFFFGLDRDPSFAGHQYSATDTSANMLWTILDNPAQDDLALTFAQNQAYPAWTVFHALYVGNIADDTLSWDYYFDLSDSTLLVWDGIWSHITAGLTDLPDSVAVGFYYEGYDADNWFIDDIEFCYEEPAFCPPVAITGITAGGGTVSLTWAPVADVMVNIYESADAYDFSGATLVASVDGSLGAASGATVLTTGFYNAVVDCNPPARLSNGMTKQSSKLPASTLSTAHVAKQAARSMDLREQKAAVQVRPLK